MDVDSLFTNIPLHKIIDISTNKLFQNAETLHDGISKNDFLDLIFLNSATKESFFTFNNKIYIQIDGAVMEFPLGIILTNIFLSHHEENSINKCPVEFKPSIYSRYVNETFVLFESPESNW